MPGDFFDTNVILYLFDDTDSPKRKKSEELILSALDSGTGCVSHQVIQEALNVVTTKLDPPADAHDALRLIDRILLPLWRVMPGRELFVRALDVQARYRYGFYDSLIIAAAIEADCARLYSEDLQHGQRIATLRITNPYID